MIGDAAGTGGLAAALRPPPTWRAASDLGHRACSASGVGRAGAGPVAAGEVVVDQAGRLHERVDGGGADVAHPPLAQRAGELGRLRRLGGICDRSASGAVRATGACDHTICLSDVPASRIAPTAMALAMVAVILPRCRTMPGSASSRSTSRSV